MIDRRTLLETFAVTSASKAPPTRISEDSDTKVNPENPESWLLTQDDVPIDGLLSRYYIGGFDEAFEMGDLQAPEGVKDARSAIQSQIPYEIDIVQVVYAAESGQKAREVVEDNLDASFDGGPDGRGSISKSYSGECEDADIVYDTRLEKHGSVVSVIDGWYEPVAKEYVNENFDLDRVVEKPWN
jgi:hypothetical protein